MAARQSAIAAGLPIIPGTDEAVTTAEQAVAFVTQHGCPVILKVNRRPRPQHGYLHILPQHPS